MNSIDDIINRSEELAKLSEIIFEKTDAELRKDPSEIYQYEHDALELQRLQSDEIAHQTNDLNKIKAKYKAISDEVATLQADIDKKFIQKNSIRKTIINSLLMLVSIGASAYVFSLENLTESITDYINYVALFVTFIVLFYTIRLNSSALKTSKEEHELTQKLIISSRTLEEIEKNEARVTKIIELFNQSKELIGENRNMMQRLRNLIDCNKETQ
ncbi:hypothetical protein [Vibrio jasicida]|uniref:hypothetical protein n=1 Tax=Vibrio jasicida TaxID=766224 RepID=UPI0003A5DECB|nr:hypothetical protein [Vibrio jasicida]